MINNTKILQSLQYTNFNILVFLEALHLTFKRQGLYNGFKALKEVMFLLIIAFVNSFVFNVICLCHLPLSEHTRC